LTVAIVAAAAVLAILVAGALALDRRRLERARTEDARRAEGLARLAQGLAGIRTSDDVMPFLTEAVLPPLDAVHAAVAVIEGDRLRRHFTAGRRAELLGELLPPTIALDSTNPLAEAARTGKRVLVADVHSARERYPELVEGWKALGYVATANLPLRDRAGELIGSLGVAWDRSVDLPALEDQLTTIAGIAGQTLDRALLSDVEHRLVTTLQKSLLAPLSAPAGLAVAARYLPAAREVGMGGDWYEGIALPGDRFDVVVGDVAGHGVEAVGQMARLRAVIGALAALDLAIGDLFTMTTSLPQPGRTVVASAALVQLDMAAGTLSYVCAGHPPPIVRAPGGSVTVLDDGRQPLLGLPAGGADPPGTAPFPPGSVLVAYTDGLIERRDRPVDESIRALVRDLEAVESADPDRIADHLLERCLGGHPPDDDVALVVVARTGC